MATRDEIASEILDRMEEENPSLYQALLGRVPAGRLPDELQQPDKDRAGWEAEQKQMKAELDNRLKNLTLTNLKGQAYLTQKYRIHDEMRSRGLGQAYSPEAAPKSPEQLEASYRAEIAKVRPGSEAARMVRAKFRKAGMNI